MLEAALDVQSEKAMVTFNLPPEVERVIREFWTCELSTLARDGTPITWPVLPIYRPGQRQFVILATIGLPQKTINIRRNPRVSLLFSEPLGSGLSSPPAVLVQGNAEAPDVIHTRWASIDNELREDLLAQTRRVIKDQPAPSAYVSNPVVRYLFDWYFMRLMITITPCRILWWDHGDFGPAPHEIKVTHVE